tara:strand:+ start:78 stop:299 length:222 start_codon:yes stop_codon:yes gene_type:complete
MKDDEIFIYLMLIVIGYFIAKMFSRSSCNGFKVGGHLRYSQGECTNYTLKAGDFCNAARAPIAELDAALLGGT